MHGFGATIRSKVVRLFAIWTDGPRFNPCWVQEVCVCVFCLPREHKDLHDCPNLMQIASRKEVCKLTVDYAFSITDALK
jgi:hypothetical protein